MEAGPRGRESWRWSAESEGLPIHKVPCENRRCGFPPPSCQPPDISGRSVEGYVVLCVTLKRCWVDPLSGQISPWSPFLVWKGGKHMPWTRVPQAVAPGPPRSLGGQEARLRVAGAPKDHMDPQTHPEVGGRAGSPLGARGRHSGG